jgi:hypothetical protein
MPLSAAAARVGERDERETKLLPAAQSGACLQPERRSKSARHEATRLVALPGSSTMFHFTLSWHVSALPLAVRLRDGNCRLCITPSWGSGSLILLILYLPILGACVCGVEPNVDREAGKGREGGKRGVCQWVCVVFFAGTHGALAVEMFVLRKTGETL